MILAGDIGGTKTVLALYETGVGHLEKVAEATYPSRSALSLDELIARFMEQHDASGLTAACFGVPGAIVDGVCKATNLPWVIDERKLAVTLKTPRVRLLNDLQAAAYGMLHLDDSELVLLNPGRSVDRKKNMAVIAAGTGLGEAMLVWDGEKHVPVASEGGHATFSPRNELEIELMGFLSQRTSSTDSHGHVSWERVCSGPGLANCYDFLVARGGSSSDAVVARMEREDKGSVIGLEAVNDGDKLCVQAAKLFCTLYGAEAGNLALKCFALGGVFIGGGIAPKLLPVLQQGDFMKAFAAKGRFRALLEGIPVVVATNDKAPLIGAANFAARLR